MKTILVTGGCGFIGSHTCIDLIQEGHNVIAIDSLINSSYKSIESIKQIIKLHPKRSKNKFVFYKGDLRDLRFLKEVFAKSSNLNHIDAVIHFAGLKSINESINFPTMIQLWDIKTVFFSRIVSGPVSLLPLFTFKLLEQPETTIMQDKQIKNIKLVTNKLIIQSYQMFKLFLFY